MKIIKTIILFISIILTPILLSCKKESSRTSNLNKEISLNQKENIINPKGKNVFARFNMPEGFTRIEVRKNSFSDYLRNLPLKPYGATVKYYDGTSKPNYNIYESVVDLPIGNLNLHQCADAVIRLKAEYLWKNKKFDEIHFNFTNGFRVDYKEWMNGKRIKVNGNQTKWHQAKDKSNTYQDFWEYLEIIFQYAGTLSLSQELESKDISQINIGDVFIQGGSPGHAIIVIDMAIHDETGEKIMLLAQSYMPAQEIQILQNPNDDAINPWYVVDEHHKLITPEWIFKPTDLKKF